MLMLALLLCGSFLGRLTGAQLRRFGRW